MFSLQFLPETRTLAKTFSVAFSQARYINRLYGVPDGFDGLLHDIPAATSSNQSERILKILIYLCGGVIFHALENSALMLYIVHRADPQKIPATKTWLQKIGHRRAAFSSSFPFSRIIFIFSFYFQDAKSQIRFS